MMTTKERFIRLREREPKLTKALEEAINDLHALAAMVPRNPCLSSGMCACSGACRKTEVTEILEKTSKYQAVLYEYD